MTKTRLFTTTGMACLMLALGLTAPLRAGAAVGIFEEQADVGKPAKAGAGEFDAKSQAYTVTGGGANMWAKADAFHFVWKKMSGDVALSAEIAWPEAGKNPHRKACLIIRQSLEADSPYVDAALHGVGLTSLQYRLAAGGETGEIQSNVNGPVRLRLEKQGDTFLMSVAEAGKPLRHAGGSIKLKLTEPFYVGLAVCAHDDGVLETARFSKVELSNEKYEAPARPAIESTLEVLDITKPDRKVVYHAAGRFEAPNWTRDGYFIFNAQGRINRLPVAGGEPEVIDTGEAKKCNNDHGVSFDGKMLAVSSAGPDGKSLIYTLPIGGGAAKQITPVGPSYWHGWSPDGKTLAFCGERGGEFDVYTVPAEGGPEKRLTTATGLDDGPEYTPDGQWIYFNSVRSGTMQVWRMHPDGAGQEQVTNDEYNNWFPHVSPNGKWIVFVSFDKSVDPKLHPADKDVQLRLMPVGGGEIRTLARVFGGQGTMNVNSWSPDSKQVGYVSYLWVKP